MPGMAEGQDPGPALSDGIPALGMGLSRLAHWSTQHPFLDLMKSARDWSGYPADRGDFDGRALRAAGYVGADGWPLEVPEGLEGLRTLILTDQPADAGYLRGDYVLTYEGQAEIEVGGRARRLRPEPGRIVFAYEPGPGSVTISVSEIDGDDPIRNIRVVREDLVPLWEAGAVFNPEWIERISDLRVLRFTDWMATNGSLVSRWEDRPRAGDATWTAWGVPLPVMIELANRVGVDPWFNMPHLADDTYVRRFAEVVEARLDPDLKAHVEYSTAVWDSGFPQADWMRQQAEMRWGPSKTGWAQFYGLRAAQVMEIWADVFGAKADERLVRIAATRTGEPGIEEYILKAPLALLETGHFPLERFDAYAISGYFGEELGEDAMAPRVEGWLSRGEQAARQAGERQGLQRVALREFVRDRRFDEAFSEAAGTVEAGSLGRLVEDLFPYHAAVAEASGLRLILSEGGTRAVGRGARVDDAKLTAFLTAFNYSPEMARLYDILLSGWVDAGGTLFTAFADVAAPSKYGSWGALRHLEDSNPRWEVLMAYNGKAPADWAPRDLSAFADGVTRVAGEAGATLRGTPQADVLVGGTGDDRLVGAGGHDRLHGGAGWDIAVLPGRRDAYRFSREGPRLVASGPGGVVKMAGIEELVFSAEADQPVAASGL